MKIDRFQSLIWLFSIVLLFGCKKEIQNPDSPSGPNPDGTFQQNPPPSNNPPSNSNDAAIMVYSEFDFSDFGSSIQVSVGSKSANITSYDYSIPVCGETGTAYFTGLTEGTYYTVSASCGPLVWNDIPNEYVSGSCEKIKLELQDAIPSSFGVMFFYLSKYTHSGGINLSVYVDGTFHGQITEKALNYPNCGDAIGVTILYLIPGTHSYRVENNIQTNYYWEGTRTVSAGYCSAVNLGT